jgi:hypothetical protein
MLTKQEYALLITCLKLVKRFRMCFDPAEMLNVQIDELIKKLESLRNAKEVSLGEAAEIVMGFINETN